MRQTQRKLQIAAVGVVAVVWTARWVVIAVDSGLAPDTAVQLLLFSTLIWAGAALLLLNQWLSGKASRMSTKDAPGRRPDDGQGGARQSGGGAGQEGIAVSHGAF